MTTRKTLLKLLVLFLVLGGVLLGGIWTYPTDDTTRTSGEPTALQARLLSQPTVLEARPLGEPEAKSEMRTYQTWQELAYMSLLFKRLAHTYYGLEKTALERTDRSYLVEPIGDDRIFRWMDPDPCVQNPFPPCGWSVAEFASCDSMLSGSIGDVFARVARGIAMAQDILGHDGEFTFTYTELKIPDEDWFETPKKEKK